ncbi:MAG TPA: HAD family hydrolase [Steroidobacteraceae bacterium]|jgi:HAD superfamily hydrolase (TIGR01509 family)|nr:HAD family hydrolase [Steroidobacteraceae bacterium]
MAHEDVSFIFDLDGTLVDSVYQHVMAWQEALQAEQIELSMWRIHRRIGMSGGLFTGMLLREVDVAISPSLLERLQTRHSEAYGRLVPSVRPLPGALALLKHLTRTQIPWAIATSGNMDVARYNLDLLGIDPQHTPVVTRNDVKRAKPDPDLFLAAAGRLHIDISSAVIVGDSIWDMLAARRARGLGVGVLSGGYGQDELERAGAIRVYEDPADLLRHIDEIGGRT